MQLQFYGAAGEVTGSCHILTVQDRRLLLDCGLIQGGDDPDARNREAFPFDAGAIDAVVLSHAHIDHCGRLPLLRKRGFRGPIYATPACRDLARILLADSAFMAEREADRARRHGGDARRGRSRAATEPLFTTEDAAATLRQFETVPYERVTEALPGVRVTFRDAGHILGSASVWLDLEENGAQCRLVFSGDVGQYDSPILRDPEVSGGADVVVMESTYGDRRHRERQETLAEFGQILRDARRNGGNALIPAFAVGRSQEVLYALATHFDEWRVGDWQVFLDSPLAIEASGIYWRHPGLYDAEAAAARRKAEAMPPLPNLALCRTADESKALNRIRDGAIIIAGSGMCTGGRIVHHLKHNLPRPECDVIFTGYQAVGTLGRAIVDRREEVRIHGEAYRVAAQVHTLGGFSAHGDQQDLLRWHSGLSGPRHTFLVHGEHVGATGLRDALRGKGVRAEVARAGQRIDLGGLA
ncbi:MAG TPA: MBL fold metallo-hydrolase [Steroidobacteraceae bacterium]|nr:MBL fold metallo-hydrolase [Steroidobacteraceae bacterium]